MDNSQRSLKVFISHSSSDKPSVRALSRRLRNDGIDVWLDEDRLLGGMDWSFEIQKAVYESDIILVCISKNSMNKEGYVQKEIKIALDRALEKPEDVISLIPVRLEVCKVPDQLSRYHWVDLFEENGYEKVLLSLRRSAERLGIRTEKIQIQKNYWGSTLAAIRGVDGLDFIASITDRLGAMPNDASEDLKEVHISIQAISQYTRASINSETEYNRAEQLHEARAVTKKLLKYLESIPPWRIPENIRKEILFWEEIFDSELKKDVKVAIIPNVYVAGSPLSEKSKVFKGRKDIFRILERELVTEADQRPALLLFGARRTGKTSVLRQLPNTLGPQVIPVMLDLQSMALTNNIVTFLDKLIEQIRQHALHARSIRLPEVSRNVLLSDPYMAFAEWSRDVEKSIGNKWLLLCFDEYEYFEKLIADGRADERILQLLRSILQNYSRITLLFSGAHTFEELNPIWSHYLINVRTIKIGHIENREARELIESPIDSFPLKYSKNAVERILAVVGCQPYLLQATCRDLVNIMNDEGRSYVEVKDVDKALESVLMSGSAYFKELWSGPDSDEKQRNVLSEISKANGKPVSEKILQKIADSATLKALVRHDVIEKSDNSYIFKVELVRMWVEQQT